MATPPQRRTPQPTGGQALKEYGFDFNENWHQDTEFYDKK